jgi:hypothetical protein
MIFDPISPNKTKKIAKPYKKSKYSSLSTVEYRTNKTNNQHGLLIDKYLDETITNENDLNNSCIWKYLLIFFIIFFVVYFIYYFHDNLLKTFRERHKRSVLKYSV